VAQGRQLYTDDRAAGSRLVGISHMSIEGSSAFKKIKYLPSNGSFAFDAEILYSFNK